MQTMHSLLSQNPTTFNELLDLFAAYVGSIGGPINKGHDMLREEIGAGEHDALGLVFGVVDDADRMAARLTQIRAARNTGTDVAIILTQIERSQLDTAIPNVIDLLTDTASMLDLLSGGFDCGSIDPNQPAIASTLRVLCRALRGAEQLEVPALMMADLKIRKAVRAVIEAEQHLALGAGEAA